MLGQRIGHFCKHLESFEGYVYDLKFCGTIISPNCITKRGFICVFVDCTLQSITRIVTLNIQLL
jgi:hypothetical protein